MKVAVLGAGRMGETVLGHLRECGGLAGLVAFDPDPQRLRLVAEKYGVSTTGNLETVLQDADVRLVFITAVNHAHASLAIRAMRAGKAVMCEKPMATTPADAREMVRVAEQCGAYLQIGFELRYSTLYTTVKQWIDQGLLGEMRNTFCNYICSEFRGRNSWRNTAEGSGGMFGEKLSHYADLSRWWVGSPVTEVQSVCAPNVVGYYEGVHDNYHTTWRYANGAVSHLSFAMHVAETYAGDPLQDVLDQQRDDGHVLRFLVYGTCGAAETDVFRRQLTRWTFTDTAAGWHSKIVERTTWTPDEDHRYFHNTRDQAIDIVRRVKEGLPPKTSAADSLATMELCFAAEDSADRQQVVPASPLMPAAAL